MKNLVNINTNQPLTMSSREIAEYTGKQHAHVMRDIESMFSELELNIDGCLHFWIHPQNNQEYKEYLLDRDQTDCLLTGYSAKARMSVIKRWKELEQSQLPLPSSQMKSSKLALQQVQEQIEDTKAALISQESDRVTLSRMVEIETEHEQLSAKVGIINRIEQAKPKYGREAEDVSVMEYINNHVGDYINFESLCKSVMRRKDSPFKIYTRRGEARDQVRNTVARLDEIINRRIH